MNISFFVPAYNEEGNIERLVRSAEEVLSQLTDQHEIIVVLYEGSTDNTDQILQRLVREIQSLRVVYQRERDGYGEALRLGFASGKHEYIFYADSDNQFDLNELEKFIPYVPEYDMVVGYRINRQDPFHRLVTAKMYNLTARVLFGIPFRDVDCAFKLCHRRIFDKVSIEGRRDGDLELLVKAQRAGFKIKELGVHHYRRLHGKPDPSLRKLPRIAWGLAVEALRLFWSIRRSSNGIS